MKTGNFNQKWGQPYCAGIGDIATDFSADAYYAESIKKIKLSEFKGKWVMLFFYSSDFTFV